MSDAWGRLVDKYIGVGKPKEGAHGWIQWKGTDVCMDFHCVCGEHTHLDCDFTYLIQCGACKRVYWPNAHIQMTELTGDDLKDALESNPKVTQVDE